MPNWCEGTLKVRGDKEDIINFLKNGIEPMGLFGDTEKPEVDENENHIIVKTDKDGFYLKNTRRAFIEEGEIWFSFEQKVLLLEFKQAWGIITEQLAEISREFNLDLKIYAYEKGMEFNRDIEIHKGEIIKDLNIEFDDYNWECANPSIGG